MRKRLLSMTLSLAIVLTLAMSNVGFLACASNSTQDTDPPILTCEPSLTIEEWTGATIHATDATGIRFLYYLLSPDITPPPFNASTYTYVNVHDFPDTHSIFYSVYLHAPNNNIHVYAEDPYGNSTLQSFNVPLEPMRIRS